MASKKVLIITYYWPPRSGAGVHRVLRFCKYLTESEWEPVILTPQDASSYGEDRRLTDAVAHIRTYRTPIWEPVELYKKFTGSDDKHIAPAEIQVKPVNWRQSIARWIRLNLFIPDAKIGWIPHAVKAGKKIIEKEQPDLIFSTAPPPTAHLIARRLAKWSKLKWVADFRDPWTRIYYYDQAPLSSPAKWYNRRLEKKVLTAADAITVVNHGFFPDYHFTAKFTHIPNGFDPAIKENIPAYKRNPAFTIRYTGSWMTNQYVPELLHTLNQLKDEYQTDIHLEILGVADQSVKKQLKRDAGQVKVTCYPYAPHEEAIRFMAQADLLLLSIGKGRLSKSIYTSKLFEYILMNRPVLGYGPPDGSAAEILAQSGAGKMFKENDHSGVEKFLREAIKRWRKKELVQQNNIAYVEQFDFRHLTRKLANVFQQKT